MLDAKSDNELLEAVKNGEQSAFEELTNRYAGKVYNIAKRLVKSTEDAEEVLQDVFVTLYKKIATFEGRSSFSSWIYRITVNVALMKNRSNKKERSVLLNETTEEESFSINNVDEYEPSHRELLSELEKAIWHLPEEFRSVYVLRDIDGLSSKEVSTILNLSIPAVKSRLHKSRFLVREELEQFYAGSKDSNQDITFNIM